MASRSFSRLYHDLSRRPDVTEADKTVYAALEHYQRLWGAGDGTFAPSTTQLAEHAGVHPVTVLRCLKRLAALALLTVERRHGRRNRYRLHEGAEPHVAAAKSGNKTGSKSGNISAPEVVAKCYHSPAKSGSKMLPPHKEEESYIYKKQQQQKTAAAADMPGTKKGEHPMPKKPTAPPPAPPDPTTAAKLARETARAEMVKYLAAHVSDPRALARITAQPGLTLGVCQRVVREYLNSSGRLGVGWLVDTLSRAEVWRTFDAAAPGPTPEELRRKNLAAEQARRETRRAQETNDLQREAARRQALLALIPPDLLPDLLTAARHKMLSKPATVPADWRTNRWWSVLVLQVWRERCPDAYAGAEALAEKQVQDQAGPGAGVPHTGRLF